MRNLTASLLFLCVPLAFGCSVESTKAESGPARSTETASEKQLGPASATSIEILAGSPADTVRAFYAKLRDRKIREAIFLTNLRPAIEGLTDDELREFAVDFDAVAKNVPAEIEINGEIISGDTATVTAKLPDEDNEKLVLQQIRLRKDGEHWMILSADEEAEKQIRKEGNKYFHTLRIATHHDEAKAMMERISKAQTVNAIQNGGKFAAFDKLIADGLLPEDVKSSETTGYSFAMKVADDGRSYRVDATPAVYGKSGNLSFSMESSPKGMPTVKSGDVGGKPLTK